MIWGRGAISKQKKYIELMSMIYVLLWLEIVQNQWNQNQTGYTAAVPKEHDTCMLDFSPS